MSAGWTFPGEPEAEPRPNGHAGATGDAPGGSPFRPIDFPSLLGREAPPREYTVPGWMPTGCVTGLWGEGGVGKSMLAQQIATCVATGIAAFGFEVGGTGGPVVGVFTEDDHDELWRRQARINAAVGLDMTHLRDLHLQGRAGLENTLVSYAPGKPPAVQPLARSIVQACEAHRPALVILDNIAQLFAGNENDRHQVSHFCNAVGGIAVSFGCSVLLLGHPAKAEGSQYSGSTAWNGAVRARAFLAHDKDGELRLTRHKANYSARDADAGLALAWVDGVLRSSKESDDGPMGASFKRDVERRAEEAFLAALDRLTELGEVVAFSPQAGNHAPKIMIKMGLTGELRDTVLRDAIVRLVDRGELVTDYPVKRRSGRRWAYGLARAPAEGAPRPDEEEKAGDRPGAEAPPKEDGPGSGDDIQGDPATGPKTGRGAPCSTVPPSYRGGPRRGARSAAGTKNRGATAERNRGAGEKPATKRDRSRSKGGASDAEGTAGQPRSRPRSRPRERTVEQTAEQTKTRREGGGNARKG
jgi:RecA-family ATPase